MRPRSSPPPRLRLWWNISFSTPGTAPECRLTSKSAPILVTVLLLRGRTPPTQSGFKKKKKADRMLCNSTQMFSEDHWSESTEKRAFCCYTMFDSKKRSQQGHGLLGSQPGPSRTRLKILSYILKVSGLSKTDEALKEGGKRKFGDVSGGPQQL